MGGGSFAQPPVSQEEVEARLCWEGRYFFGAITLLVV